MQKHHSYSPEVAQATVGMLRAGATNEEVRQKLGVTRSFVQELAEPIRAQQHEEKLAFRRKIKELIDEAREAGFPSNSDVADYINGLEIKTPTGEEWTALSVQRMERLALDTAYTGAPSMRGKGGSIVTDAMKDEIVADYQGGMSWADLMKKHALAQDTMRKLIHEQLGGLHRRAEGLKRSEIAKAFVAKHPTMRGPDLVALLEAEGIETPSGKPWSHTMISHIRKSIGAAGGVARVSQERSAAATKFLKTLPAKMPYVEMIEEINKTGLVPPYGGEWTESKVRNLLRSSGAPPRIRQSKRKRK